MQTIKGKVIHGKKLSRQLGFKTANIEIKKDALKEVPLKGIIQDGVYKINIKIENNIYRGIGTYIEKNEVFEAHIFNFEEDIYGKFIEINIFDKIRNNKKFGNIEELKKQINLDIEKVQNINNYVLTFGTFDILHPGHNYYLNNAKFYGDILITIIATDNNVAKFKGIFPENNYITRVKNLEKINITDKVIVGEENSPMKYIDFYSPIAICLGYDQIGFSSILEKYIKEKKLKTKIIRLLPYKENIYKSSLLKKKS